MVIVRLLTCSQECASFVRLREVAEVKEYTNTFDRINGEDGRQRHWKRQTDYKQPQQEHKGILVTQINTVLGVAVIIGMGQVHRICGVKGHKDHECPKKPGNRPY